MDKRKKAADGMGSLRPRPTAGKTVDITDVHERIWSAIMDHSLPPETRLVETELCEIFGLGRTRLRQVLQKLAHERVVTLMRNRGAMVSKPRCAKPAKYSPPGA